MRDGELSFDFLDLPSWEWYGGFVSTTFQQLAAETGLPLELLQAIRESMGSARPEPNDPVHEQMLDLIPVIRVVLDAGVDPAAVERLIRVWGECIRRLTEAASSFYHAQIEVPLLRSGMSEAQDVAGGERTRRRRHPRHRPRDHRDVPGHSEHVWMANVVEAVEATLEKAGLHHAAADPPAMSFVDLSGYTRLTEDGDEAAAEMAATLGELVQRSASGHGGRAVKWLGDGVMLYFADPDEAVISALELAERVPAAALPPSHTGVDAGPVIFQDGDYFGRTVNTAARIAGPRGAGTGLRQRLRRTILAQHGDPIRRRRTRRVKGLPNPIRLHQALSRV